MSKSWFELMQHELEEVTEKLSEMLQRPHLRTPKRALMQALMACLQKRSDFLKAVYNGLQFEDPWRNRTMMMGQNSAKCVNLASDKSATLNRHQLKKIGNRQSWTKTLTYPNKKCLRPGCRNSCSNVRSSVKNFCTPTCAQESFAHQMSSSKAPSEGLKNMPTTTVAVVKKNNPSAEQQESRKVLTDLHNTLPRSSKSEDDLLSSAKIGLIEASNEGLSYPAEKVKAAGYKPLINQEASSTTSEDTLKVESLKKSSEIVIETTSQRKTRPKLFRQKSFEIDSDSNTDTSLADVSNLATSEIASSGKRGSVVSTSNGQVQNKLPTLDEKPNETCIIQAPASVADAAGPTLTVENLATTTSPPTAVNKTETKELQEKKKKKPALTIKIQNSSFNDNDEKELASELEKSPNIYISGTV